MRHENRKPRTIKEKKVFYDTSIGEELMIVDDYEKRGRHVVGWERVLMGSLVMFCLYLG
jgi:hypothetical protein